MELAYAKLEGLEDKLQDALPNRDTSEQKPKHKKKTESTVQYLRTNYDVASAFVAAIWCPDTRSFKSPSRLFRECFALVQYTLVYVYITVSFVLYCRLNRAVLHRRRLKKQTVPYVQNIPSSKQMLVMSCQTTIDHVFLPNRVSCRVVSCRVPHAQADKTATFFSPQKRAHRTKKKSSKKTECEGGGGAWLELDGRMTCNILLHIYICSDVHACCTYLGVLRAHPCEQNLEHLHQLLQTPRNALVGQERDDHAGLARGEGLQQVIDQVLQPRQRTTRTTTTTTTSRRRKRGRQGGGGGGRGGRRHRGERVRLFQMWCCSQKTIR